MAMVGRNSRRKLYSTVKETRGYNRVERASFALPWYLVGDF